MDPEKDDYSPSPWLPIERLDIRQDLPIQVPEDAWLRTLEEPDRRFPYLHFEVAWVTQPVLHLATIAGFSWGQIPGDDGRDEREVVSHRRISFETITRVKLGLGPNDQDTIELVGGEVLVDGPALLVHQHMSRS